MLDSEIFLVVFRKKIPLTGRQLNIALKQSLRQIIVLIASASAIAIGSNFLRTDGIPLVGDWSLQARFADAAGQGLIIDLSQAQRLFESGAAVFVDARPQQQHAEGHIRGALSLPFQDVDRYFLEVADRLEGPWTIVTYCDGENCELSHELALFLIEMGFENVRVLVNGWTAWQQAGLPTDRGR